MFTLDLTGPGFERRSVEFSAKTATVGSIMERDSLYLPNCQTNLVIALHALSQWRSVFCKQMPSQTLDGITYPSYEFGGKFKNSYKKVNFSTFSNLNFRFL